MTKLTFRRFSLASSLFTLVLMSGLSNGCQTSAAAPENPPPLETPKAPQNEPVAQGWKAEPPITVSAQAFDGSRQGFHPYANWMAMQLPPAPMKGLLEKLQTQTGERLKSRGESHVTVLTPPEFGKIKKWVKIAEVNEIALKNSLQASKIEPVCLGRGRAKIQGKDESTYFVVVQSEDLLRIRRAIKELIVKKGGTAELFDPEAYQPHVTIGFTNVDLHVEQGVIKDERSCILPLKTQK